MADLRNKFAKQERTAALERWRAQHQPRKPDPKPLQCCLCGAIPSWAEHGTLGRVKLYCEECRVKVGLKI